MHTFFINDSIQIYCLRHVSNTIKLHVQVFLRMNTRLLETCRKQYGLISHIKKTVHCGGSYYVCVTQYTVQKHEDAIRPFSPFM
jgi:hypothetical protein